MNPIVVYHIGQNLLMQVRHAKSLYAVDVILLEDAERYANATKQTSITQSVVLAEGCVAETVCTNGKVKLTKLSLARRL